MVLLAILFHLGYHDLWSWFKPYIDIVYSLGHPVDLYISYQKKSDLFKSIQSQYPTVTFVECSRGMDIGGQLLMTKAAIESNKPYDYVLKLHTKGNSHWRLDLVDAICGSAERVDKILNIFQENRKIGMIGSAKWKWQDDNNRGHVDQLCNKFNFQGERVFIGGTMFWLRWSTMLHIVQSKKMDLKEEHDHMELGKPGEPSLTHAWERVLGIMIRSVDQEIYGIGNVDIPKDFDYQWYVNNHRDLAEAGMKTYDVAIAHWSSFGKAEGRSYKAPNSRVIQNEKRSEVPNQNTELSWQWYIRFYPDLPTNGVTTEEAAIQHWNTFGRKEGRFPNEIAYNQSQKTVE